MDMKAGEVVDRYTIVKLCKEREPESHNVKEHERLLGGIIELGEVYPELPWDDIVSHMYKINGFIWEHESPIHTGKFDVEPSIAGTLAIKVRKLNSARVGFSKLIDKLVEGVE